jgi:hypothetical protein
MLLGEAGDTMPLDWNAREGGRDPLRDRIQAERRERRGRESLVDVDFDLRRAVDGKESDPVESGELAKLLRHLKR